MRWVLLLLLILAVGTGCRTTVATELAQDQALHVAAALHLQAIDARVNHDDGTFSVSVAVAERERAIEAIVVQQLLRPLAGPQTLTPRSGLDATHATRRHEDERAVEIAQALELIPGVLRARVTLSLCDPPTRTAPICPNPNQLSALLLLAADATPPSADDLRPWLAASVPQLHLDDVQVLVTAHAPRIPLAAPEHDKVSALSLRSLVSASVLVLLAIGGCGALWRQRRRRQRPALSVADRALLPIEEPVR